MTDQNNIPPNDDLEDITPAPRTKTKRDRIKLHRAKRNRRRFYVIINGEERARDTRVRVGQSKNFNKN